MFIYGECVTDRRMRSETKLAREIQLTDWSTAGNLSNRSAGVQIPRVICTRFGCYLYSTKGSWIIIEVTVTFDSASWSNCSSVFCGLVDAAFFLPPMIPALGFFISGACSGTFSASTTAGSSSVTSKACFTCPLPTSVAGTLGCLNAW